jgi:23S rRNA (adenine2503-C2)-methyltransferase
MLTSMPNLYDMDFDQLQTYVLGLGEPGFRARQIWHWLYSEYASSFDQMTDLPKALRQYLATNTKIGGAGIAALQQSSDESTEKLLFQLNDQKYIETVLMRYDKRRTVCISTQAGCAMGCVFCATGQMGFSRNLSVGEIVGQVLHYAAKLAEEGDRVTNVVLMGMGEPLHNYENTMAAVDRLTDGEGFNLGARKITISTVGLVPAIRRYAEERRQTPLAVSLHAASDEEREKLIPIARRWPLDVLMDACHYYVTLTKRRLTFEWALISGENDTVDQARRLGQLLEGLKCHVNLIPLNPTAGYTGRPSDRLRVDAFQQELSKYGVNSTVRVRRGIDIQAGCGQLRDRLIKGQADN